MGETFTNENLIQEFFETIFAPKLAQFYSKGITDKWQQYIACNDENLIE